MSLLLPHTCQLSLTSLSLSLSQFILCCVCVRIVLVHLNFIDGDGVKSLCIMTKYECPVYVCVRVRAMATPDRTRSISSVGVESLPKITSQHAFFGSHQGARCVRIAIISLVAVAFPIPGQSACLMGAPIPFINERVYLCRAYGDTYTHTQRQKVLCQFSFVVVYHFRRRRIRIWLWQH